jgi:hypothetical protein
MTDTITMPRKKGVAVREFFLGEFALRRVIVSVGERRDPSYRDSLTARQSVSLQYGRLPISPRKSQSFSTTDRMEEAAVRGDFLYAESVIKAI